MGLQKPRRLQKGDRIGICAPSSPHASKVNYERACRALEELGLQPEPSPNLWNKHGYLAGTDEERADDINLLFSRPDIAGIMAIKGGYGSGRILEYLDWPMIEKNPKVFVGFSDITSLHLALYQKADMVTFHGPVLFQLAPERCTPYMIEGLRRAIMDCSPLGNVEEAPEETSFTYTINPGQAEGPLTGGCLSLVVQTLGTPYEIDTAGKILFLEEVGEEPYKVDGMLQHLYRAGKLQEAAGIVFGECVDCAPRPHRPSFHTSSFILEEVLAQCVGSLDTPAFYGLPLGHSKHIATIPYGVRARMDAETRVLHICEGATVEE